MNSFEKFNEKKLPTKEYFYSSTKGGKIRDDGKILDGHISVKNYLTCEKIWDKFEMEDHYYHNHSQPARDIPWTSLEGPLKVLTCRSLGDLQGTLRGPTKKR